MNYSATPVTALSKRNIKNISETSLEDAKNLIKEYHQHLIEKTNNHMGYPYNLDFDYTLLNELRDFSINNLGDPFIESNYGVHSRSFEIAVLDWFADLWQINREDYWGYVTACGTEGNLQGIYIGRENYPNGVLYASEDSHYSVFKAARMYKMKCEVVKSNENGTINIEHLKELLNSNKEFPAIVNVNIGTTVKGAVDDLDAIIESLRGFQFYIHCDGALAGIMLSFMENPNYLSFHKPIGSISVSGHKFIGSPDPCGIIITRLKSIKVLSSNIEYINSRDATIMGSRNGHAAIYLWYALVKKTKGDLFNDTQKCIAGAHFLCKQLKARKINCLLNKWSSTVVFKTPQDSSLIKKWQLACSGDICHIVVMPNITNEKLLEFINEYK